MLGIFLSIWLVLAGFPVQAGEMDSPETRSGDAVSYRFENENFHLSKIELTFDLAGNGHLVFERHDLTAPIERDVRVGIESLTQIQELLGRLDFVMSSEEYQSKSSHPNLGTVTVGATLGGRAREVRFNYSTNRDVMALATTLRSIATRAIYVFDLERAVLHQPLDTPKLIDLLGEDIARGRIADPVLLLPLLRSIEDDVTLPLIARNRAAKVAAKIEKSQKKGG